MRRASNTSNAVKQQHCALQSCVRRRSQRGASLLLALFLFMICSLLAAIVLSASTAAVGSYKGITEMDQRYYSVTSAADVLKSKIDNDSLSMQIVRTKDGQGNETTTSIKIEGNDSACSYNGNTLTINESVLSLSELSAVYWLLGGKHSDNKYTNVTDIPVDSITDSVKSDFVLDFEADGMSDTSNLDVPVDSTVDGSGLTLRIASPHDENDDKYYTLALHFDTDVDKSESESTRRNAEGADIVTTTTTVKLTWMAADITKAGA